MKFIDKINTIIKEAIGCASCGSNEHLRTCNKCSVPLCDWCWQSKMMCPHGVKPKQKINRGNCAVCGDEATPCPGCRRMLCNPCKRFSPFCPHGK